MNSLVFAFSASLCTALVSLFFRKNTDKSTSNQGSSGYLVIFYIFSLISSILYFPKIWSSEVNYIILSIGALVGLLSSTLMALTAQALTRGPAGLTFAFQNASAIFPGLILFLLLGSNYGFSCSYIQLAGMAIVLFGLFIGAKKEASNGPKASSKWLTYALACFFIQILALTFIQARCVLFDCEGTGSFFSNFSVTENDDIWFLPGQFSASLMMQAFLFVREKRSFKKLEVVYGTFGGIANFASMLLLLLATKYAVSFEKGIVFPCFAVASMILCNLWASKLYNEKFNFKTNSLCSFGIFMAVS